MYVFISVCCQSLVATGKHCEKGTVLNRIIVNVYFWEAEGGSMVTLRW